MIDASTTRRGRGGVDSVVDGGVEVVLSFRGPWPSPIPPAWAPWFRRGGRGATRVQAASEKHEPIRSGRETYDSDPAGGMRTSL